jgi:hypothetical protein
MANDKRNSSVGLSRLLWTMSDICKISDDTRVVGKCLQIFFETLLWVRLCMGMENTPIHARFFVHKKYTTFGTERIVALRSVNKILPESYDFAAN